MAAAESDPRANLSHVLGDGESSKPTEQPAPPAAAIASDAGNDTPTVSATTETAEPKKPAETPRTAKKEDDADATPQYSATGTTTRRNANGSVSSVYAGNRIRYLKKKDGEPLWRKDLQFNFLCEIFKNEQRVFTMVSDGSTNHTFAEIYIDAMAKSSKCSQVLKDKLATDKSAAVDMAIICLLVNVGRMNTTLNFFPEMRARVRTYHPIPCLQHQSGSNVSKQLQDGPRLKSILKGATEDTPQPSTIEALEQAQKPRGNPVNLLFALSQYAPKISEKHFFPPRDFFDLFVRPTITSKSRARAFLWLVWWYLESDFTEKDAESNPFGPGQASPEGGMKIKVPPLDAITEAQADEENMDTEEEIQYGEEKKKEREYILSTEPTSSRSVKRSGKNSGLTFQSSRRDSISGSDSGASPPPGQFESSFHEPSSGPGTPRGFTAANRTPGSRIKGFLQEDGTPSGRGRGRGNYARRSRELTHDHQSIYPAIAPNQPPVLSFSVDRSFSPAGSARGYHSRVGQDGSVQLQWDQQPDQPKSRRGMRSALTTDQQRRQRMESLLFGQMRGEQQTQKQSRYHRGVMLDSMLKCLSLPDGYDSDDDPLQRRGGVDDLVPTAGVKKGEDGHEASDVENLVPHGDVGFQAALLADAFRKAGSSLDGIKTVRPRGIHPPKHVPDSDFPIVTRRLGSTRGSRLDSSPAANVPVPAGRMAADDPRRKRPYKPRAKRGEGLRNPANRHLLQQHREALRAESGRGRRGGSMRGVKRKRGSLKTDSGRADSEAIKRASAGVPMSVWAKNGETDGQGNAEPSVKRVKSSEGGAEDNATEIADSTAAPEDGEDQDMEDELLGDPEADAEGLDGGDDVDVDVDDVEGDEEGDEGEMDDEDEEDDEEEDDEGSGDDDGEGLDDEDDGDDLDALKDDDDDTPMPDADVDDEDVDDDVDPEPELDPDEPRSDDIIVVAT